MTKKKTKKLKEKDFYLSDAEIEECVKRMEEFAFEKYVPLEKKYYNDILTVGNAVNKIEPSFVKNDLGKTEYHHIPWMVIEDVAEILTAGERKYPGENWKKCTDKNRYLNAVDRHLMDWRLDERYDLETRQSHLAHAICNLLFLAQLEKEGKI